MSEEKKETENESSAVEGYFDSLIQDFKAEDPAEEEPITGSESGESPKDMRDFSKFFNDATAFGSGFQSTIDSDPEDISDGSDEKMDFSEETPSSLNETHREIIKEPVTDDDGMIVIFDEDAGINATDGNDFSADSNISDDENGGSGQKKKRSFIEGILPWKGDSVAEIIRKIVFIASTGVFIAAGIMLLSTLVQSKEMVEEVESIAEMVTTTVATTINEQGEVVTVPPTTEERIQHNESVMDNFIDVSENVKGFIEIEGCNIHLPVVQADDNKYYLTHTYDDKKNKAGAIFMDYRCTVAENYCSPNIVLYGHNQEDGTMFGNLKNYKNSLDFYKENPVVVFNTEYGIGDYVIFAYFVTNVYEKQDSSGEVFHYHDYIETLNNEYTFNWYVNQVAERNMILPVVDVAYGDQLLVLSTCSNEYSDSRFVVMARKVREGENIADIDFSKTRMNPDAKQIDWDYLMSRTTTEEASEETTATTTVTTTETTVTTTTTPPETTTEKTTTTPKRPINDDVFSKLSLAPIVENGTTASQSSAEEEETTVPPEETEETTSKSGLSLAPKIENGTTAPVAP